MNYKKIHESVNNINLSDDAWKVIDFIKENILAYDYYFIEKKPWNMKAQFKLINELVDGIYDELLDMAATEFEYLGSDPLEHLHTLAIRLDETGNWLKNSDGDYLKSVAFALDEKVKEAQENLLKADQANGRLPEPEDDEPKYEIYCTYYDDGNGETDGDPRYENVSFSDLVDTVNKIKNKFLNNELMGSYKWSPIDRNIWDDAGEDIEDIESISKSEWEKAEDKDDCEINKLKINIYPTYGSEDDFVVVIYGDGDIGKDTLGIDESEEGDE